MKNHFKFLCSIALFTFLAAGCNQNNRSNKDSQIKPNFLFILVDDLGKEWISSSGADSVQTPFIDALAERGMSFSNAWSMPQCTPSRVALLTGQYPFNNGWINHYDVPRWGHGARFDPERNPTFANVFRNEGYKTCAAGKWQINDFRLEPEAMVNAGFDDYCMWTGGEGGNEEISGKRYWDPYIHTREGSKVYKDQFGPDIFADFIIRFMKENKDDPMLIYYPMVLTHGPLVHTPLEPDVSTKIGKHKAMVRYTDFLVGRLVRAMDSIGIRDHTYLIFTTDNGTAGNIIGYKDGHPVRGGKTYLTENGVNAPFIVNAPGLVPKGENTDALIDFTDMFATFAELAGIDVPQEMELDGKSFAQILKRPELNAREWILTMGSLSGNVGEDGMIKNWYKFRDRAIRNDRYKIYIDTLKNINRLFDLQNDPYEQVNLVNDPSLSEVLSDFIKIVNQLPEQDQHPDYTRLESSIYDVPRAYLQKSHNRDKGRSNMSPPVNLP